MRISKKSIQLFLSLMVLLIGAGWTWMNRAQSSETTSGRIPIPHKGFMAPDFTLDDINGNEIKLLNLRGQPVIVNFWASWCGPCKAEMPSLERAYIDYKGQNVQILAVNSTKQDSEANAVSFAKSYGLTFPILFDRDGEVSQIYQIRALPTTFFLDKTGVIQDVVIGGPLSEALLRIRIQELLE